MSAARPAVLTAGLAVGLIPPASVAADQGRLLGWVEDTRGTPVAGVIISLFGHGLDGGGVVTLSDSAGRFFLPSLPAGSYTVRALGAENGTAAAREVTVLPNQDSVFTLNLTSAARATIAVQDPTLLEPDADAADGELDEDDVAMRELRWLLRHKRRSVLEQRRPGAVADTPQRASLDMPEFEPVSVGGAVEVLANSTGTTGEDLSTDDASGNLGVLRLQGRLTDSISWSLAGLLAESEDTTWRSAAEFLIEPGAGHAIEAGAGYGTRLLRTPYPMGSGPGQENRSLGAIFLRDTFSIGDRLTASVGARYSYVGFVSDPNHVNPTAWLEFRGDDGMRVRGVYSVRTVAPGGDLLTVSSLAAAPDVVFALVDEELRSERVVTRSVEMERLGEATTFRVHAFKEIVEDPLLNVAMGSAADRTLRIRNAPDLVTTGGGVELSHLFGDAATGSISYTYGRSRRHGLRPGPVYGLLDFNNAHFHDVVARLETIVRLTDTRVAALYRINLLQSESEIRSGQAAAVNARFDVQVTQGLPFMAAMTSADWELLLAYRNFFYENSEGAILDEVAVVNPPRRITGGIAIRF